MQIETISPRRAVDNAFLQETITEATFETFRQRLLKLLNQADDAVQEGESEEHLKGLIKPFLNNTNFEEDHYINTKERQDLAIRNIFSHGSEQQRMAGEAFEMLIFINWMYRKLEEAE